MDGRALTVFELLKQRNASAAVKFLADTEPPDKSGLLVASGVQEFESVFSAKPQILSSVSETDMEHLRTAAGMSFALGVLRFKEWLPKEFHPECRFNANRAVMQVVNYVQNLRFLRTAKQIEIVVAVKILNSNYGPCEECQKISQKLWKLGEQPELPYPQCVCAEGCRCSMTGYTASDPEVAGLP